MDRFGFRTHVGGGEHAVDGPREIHRGRARLAHALRRFAKGRVVVDCLAKHRDAVGAEHADRRGAADGERLDRLLDLIDRAGMLALDGMRKQPLIDVRQGYAVKGDGGKIVGQELDSDGNLGRVAGPAIDRAVATRAEWDGGADPARSADGLEVRAGTRAVRRAPLAVLGSAGLTALAATLWLILESFFGEKLLLARREGELVPAVFARDRLVFHWVEASGVSFRSTGKTGDIAT